jgi:hypothetical protein
MIRGLYGRDPMGLAFVPLGEFFWAPYADTENHKLCTLEYFSVHKYRITFLSRFAVSRIDSGNLAKVEDMFTLRLASGTEF